MKAQPESKAMDNAVIEREFASLKEVARKRCENESQMDTIIKAFEFANSAHEGVRRRSGDPYILHPIAVARIVADEIGLGSRSISAALLHDILDDTPYTIDDIRNIFGDKIAQIVDGLAKIKAILDKKDMMLTLNDDIRVVLIKLADRLHNCRTIEYLPEYKREKALSETMDVFIPFAHRLGLSRIKSEMENIWLRFKEPEAYNDISMRISANAVNGDRMLEEFLVPIRKAMDDAGIKYHIKKRVKTPYSIWHKMNTKHVTFEQISDLYAVRVIFDPMTEDVTQERNECFQIFSLITNIYEYRQDRVRDWIRHPKENGYEALHLTTVKDDGTNIEVQIRSCRMDEIAEKGVAAHWNYKQDQVAVTEFSRMDLCLEKFKEILKNPDVNTPDNLDRIHDEFIENELIVYDNKGVKYTVSKGWTALDFAYMTDPASAGHAIAAKLNYRLSPLSSVLTSGDQVEIITSRNEKPKLEWLQFVKSPEAVKNVKDQLGIAQMQENVTVILELSGLDRKGLIHEISGILSHEDDICFNSVNFHVNGGQFEGSLEITSYDRSSIDKVTERLRDISGIQKIESR